MHHFLDQQKDHQASKQTSSAINQIESKHNILKCYIRDKSFSKKAEKAENAPKRHKRGRDSVKSTHIAVIVLGKRTRIA